MRLRQPTASLSLSLSLSRTLFFMYILRTNDFPISEIL